MRITDLTILVVEDDEFQRDILIRILNTLGVSSISHASNGKQALDIIHGAISKPINVALCDLKMPEMDGMELLRHLGEEHQNIAVILTSALDNKLLTSVGRMTKMYGIKLLGVIEKPVLLEGLRGLLSKYDHLPGNVPYQPTAQNFSLEEILKGIQANQFEPFFQPKINLRTGRLVGAEALARWIHPEHGVIGPHAFIPQLEQTGNIDSLTFQILKKSAEACRLFHAQGHLLTISVNLSLASLDDTELADKITNAVRTCGIDPQYVVLEITETAAMTNAATALENLARLCMNGFSLSIDDYGTGYSNLQQITRIAFSELKIDQSFVKDFADNKALRIVVESSIEMAHKLRVKSVAEGVESQQDCDALASVGCDAVQGYFIAKPMDVKAFNEFVVNYKWKPAPSASFTVPQPVNPHHNIRILLIEDDDFTRKIIIQVLHDIGFLNIIDAGSAGSALKLLDTNACDLIITDINMPVMNGLEFIKLVRSGKTSAKPDIRIVILSSFSHTEILGAALALDINGFLVKPIIPAVVEEKLTQAISEPLHLHSPLAYEVVATELSGLTSLDDRVLKTQNSAAATHRARSAYKNSKVSYLSVNQLLPGMVLGEDVYLKDGTLILSSGHKLSELLINRLIELKSLLPAHDVVIEASSSSSK